jgi:hypothetical protein
MVLLASAEVRLAALLVLGAAEVGQQVDKSQSAQP